MPAGHNTLILGTKSLKRCPPGRSNENRSHVIPQSEKRDVVGTGRIEATGKIACNAVDAEYREQRVGTSRHRIFKKKSDHISDDRSFIKAWIDECE